MERNETKTGDFFEGIPVNIPAMDDEKISIEWAALSCMMSEALVVLDFQKRNFLHLSNHYLCLCGYSPEKIKEEGYEFFKYALHPEDLSLWRDIHVIILKSLYGNELPVERIRHFGFTFRIRSFLSEKGQKPEYLMVYVKIKPQFQNGIPVRGICLLSVAVVPRSGNLCVYYDNHDFATYSFESRKWTNHPCELLTIRDKPVLVLNQQGLKNKHIADKLYITEKAVERTITLLFTEHNIVEELNPNNIYKKIQYAHNRCLVYQSPTISSRKALKRTKK
jgi:hypothetical protein